MAVEFSLRVSGNHQSYMPCHRQPPYEPPVASNGSSATLWTPVVCMLAGGLLGEPDLTVPKARLSSLRKKGERDKAQMLIHVLTGGLWPNARCRESGYEVSPLCPLCGRGPATEKHTAWECEKK